MNKPIGHIRKRILITVKAYPLPSRTYDELVCTAGITEDGQWIRIYPVPFRFLKNEGKYKKYQWVELDLKPRSDDFRPESYSPVDTGLNDLQIIENIDTAFSWRKRKGLILNSVHRVYTSLTELIEDSKEPMNTSLATFKPFEIIGFEWEEEREWNERFKNNIQQQDLFDEHGGQGARDTIKKLPYKFFYRFRDDKGKTSRMMIEDWEIGALYWNCFKQTDGKEELALQKVRQKYFDTFTRKHDIYLFLGTTKKYHQRRSKNPFVIIGVFYPPKDVMDKQHDLFSNI